LLTFTDILTFPDLLINIISLFAKLINVHLALCLTNFSCLNRIWSGKVSISPPDAVFYEFANKAKKVSGLKTSFGITH
jgi:hypothetical protein